jgi:hypothetical protein
MASKAARAIARNQYEQAKKKYKPGQGGRFKALKSALAKKGAKSPGALAAWIGRRKYGAKKMAKWSAKGRRK